MHLVSGLEVAAQSLPNQSPQTEYRLWIDTLCCPIDLPGKLTALDRIAAVYTEATHVLVLDSSISSYSYKDKPPPRKSFTNIWHVILDEATLDISRSVTCFGSKNAHLTAYRHVEGALAKSIYFQFSDGAVHGYGLLEQLLELGKKYARQMRFYWDASQEVYRPFRKSF